MPPAEEAPHGGLCDRELSPLGLAREDILDFSVSLNPYGPCSEVAAAIRAAALREYPDPTGHAARAAIAQERGIALDRVVLGNGAAELLWGLANQLAPRGPVLVVEPTFSELRRALERTGARVCEWRARAEDGYAIDLDAIGRRAEHLRASTIYLCNPNNPTGVALAASSVAAFAEARPGLRVVLDQAFLTLSTHHADAARALPENVILLRSLTKDHALAGVRVAYLVAPAPVAAALEAARPPWTTSTLAHAAIHAALRMNRFIDDCRARMFADRDALAAALRALGLDPRPTTTIFFLVSVPDATALRRRMLEHHRILVRDCSSFGLPGQIRLCARGGADDARLLLALGRELA